VGAVTLLTGDICRGDSLLTAELYWEAGAWDGFCGDLRLQKELECAVYSVGQLTGRLEHGT